MMIPEDKYIVEKAGKYLITTRPDLLGCDLSRVFRESVYDAKRYDTAKEANRTAKKVGGTVWRFNPATGNKQRITPQIPDNAKCDPCRKYIPFDGSCRNPDSEFYREPVSMEDVCEEWKEKTTWMRKTG